MCNSKKFFVLKLVAIALMVICFAQTAPAGLINNTIRLKDGFGNVGINFVFNGVTNTVTTSTNNITISTLRSNGLVKLPFAQIGVPPDGLKTQTDLNNYGSVTTSLPEGTPAGNFYYVESVFTSGTRTYLFKVTNILTGGATADNSELEKRLTVAPAECVSSTLGVEAKFTGANSGVVQVTGSSSAGTAIWVRTYEFPGGGTPANYDDLRLNGTLRNELLAAGPFDTDDGTGTCNALRVPLNFDNQDNLYLVVDTVAKSLPLVIVRPNDIVATCNDIFTYPPVGYFGCLVPTFTYSLPDTAHGGSFAINTPTLVTVTATDTLGNTARTNFLVTVVDDAKPVPDVAILPDVAGECSATIIKAPTATDSCGGAITITGTTTDPLTRTTQGTFIVTWKFDDRHGNVAYQTQKIVVKDATPPVKPILADVTGQCSAAITAAPTTTDNCAGTITGTTTDSLTRTTQGISVVTWTFADGNGNSSTATQNIVVKDTTAPVKPVLADVIGTCSTPVILKAPTTTDNCDGTITGTTTTTTLPLGTTIVTWTFRDVTGNTTTATQKVIISGLSFTGFYSPINGTGGSFGAPQRTVNKGANLAVKFDEYCSGSIITSGKAPVVQIQYFASDPAQGGTGSSLDTLPAVYQNDWHINWDTTQAKYGPGKYLIIVTLSDGLTRQQVWINLK